jgi:hypothetical protein
MHRVTNHAKLHYADQIQSLHRQLHELNDSIQQSKVRGLFLLQSNLCTKKLTRSLTTFSQTKNYSIV